MDLLKQTRRLTVPVMVFMAYAASAMAQHGEGAVESGGEHPVHVPIMPDPKDPTTWYSAIWVVIIFIVLLAILYPTAWKNILNSLKQREERIRREIANAEVAREKAEQTLRQYNERLATAESQVRDILSKAVVDAEKLATQLKMKTNQEVEEIKNRSTREIEDAKKQAIVEIHQEAAELSTAIAAKILGRAINVDDQRDLVKQSLAQLDDVN